PSPGTGKHAVRACACPKTDRRRVRLSMDSRGVEHVVAASPAENARPSPEAVDFVRFCYQRRRVGWPELYDEMCAVAGRGAFQGWGIAELAEHGIGFTLSDMPALAAIAAAVSREERERRRNAARLATTTAEPA
ncbi:MAG: hypothetical protein ACRDQC_08580, partial [Gaiellales bacterium]